MLIRNTPTNRIHMDGPNRLRELASSTEQCAIFVTAYPGGHPGAADSSSRGGVGGEGLGVGAVAA